VVNRFITLLRRRYLFLKRRLWRLHNV